MKGTAGNDAVTLTLDTDHLHVDWAMGDITWKVLIDDAAGLTINGNGGSDVIMLDYSNGNPLPKTLHLNGTFRMNGLQVSNPLAGKTVEIGRSTVGISYANPRRTRLRT